MVPMLELLPPKRDVGSSSSVPCSNVTLSEG